MDQQRAEGLPSVSSALLQIARFKAGLTQQQLAEQAGVPVTVISAYEGDQQEPTLTPLVPLLRAAGFEMRIHLAPCDGHDEVLAQLEAQRSEADPRRRDRELQAWRQARPVDGAE